MVDRNIVILIGSYHSDGAQWNENLTPRVNEIAVQACCAGILSCSRFLVILIAVILQAKSATLPANSAPPKK